MSKSLYDGIYGDVFYLCTIAAHIWKGISKYIIYISNSILPVHSERSEESL